MQICITTKRKLKDSFLYSLFAVSNECITVTVTSIAMEFLVSNAHSIKTLARVIQAASKIGDDVMLASAQTAVQLRTLSSSHSTCAEFTFTRPFFDRLQLPRTQLDVKIPTRTLLTVFRAPAVLASVRMRTSSRSHALVFTITTLKSRLRKTYRVPILDGRLGKTIFSSRGCTCMLLTRAQLFLDVLKNFHGKLDEITFTPTAAALRISSFVHSETAVTRNRVLRTEMTLDAAEFDVHRFEKTEEVVLTIFCKFFRAVLEFCEHVESPLRMWYERSGYPLLFDVEAGPPGGEPDFTAHFIFATRLTPAAAHAAATQSNPAAVTPNAAEAPPSSSAAGMERPPSMPVGEHSQLRPRLEQNALPELPMPIESAPSMAPPRARSPEVVDQGQSSDATQSPERRAPVTRRVPPPPSRHVIPDTGPSHVSETPQSEMPQDAMDVADEIRPGPPPGRSPARRPKVSDPLKNGVTPPRKRRAMTLPKETPPQSASKGASHGTEPDDVIPDTPQLNADSETPARSALTASPQTRRGSLFESDDVVDGEDVEDEDDEEYVAATPPPE